MVVGIETPETGIFATNVQGETTLHNLEGVLDIANAAMLVIATFGFVAPLVVRRRAVPAFWDWVTPPLFLGPLFLPTILYRVARLTVFQTSRLVVNRTGEWAEMCLAIALLSFMAAAAWRAGRARPTLKGA